MDAKTLELARRFAACPKWAWLPGMRVCFIFGPGARTLAKGSHFGRIDYKKPTPELFERPATVGEWLPDLDDEVTRLAMLAVVRRAYGDLRLCTRPVVMTSGEPWWDVGTPWGVVPEAHCGYAQTEIAAILDALESAPAG